MFTLKSLHADAIPAATAKAERYRFLNDASAAESICRDILHIDPKNQQVLVMLILTLTDQFGALGQANVRRAQEFLPRLDQEYQRLYYAGIICERWARIQLSRSGMGAGNMAYEWLRDAMEFYEKAEALHPTGNDETILRWNSCVRTIAQHKLEPHHDHDDGIPALLE